MTSEPKLTERAIEIAREPYLGVFGRFWEGMTFLIASGKGAHDQLTGEGLPARFTMALTGSVLDRYLTDVFSGHGEWPREYLLWQSYATTVIESHGLLDEYLRATFELLYLSKLVGEATQTMSAPSASITEMAPGLEERARKKTDRFAQMRLWNRTAQLRKLFDVNARYGPELTSALQHQRAIRNSLVHGLPTPHLVMPDGTVDRLHAFPPPPYVPLGIHIVRGAMSVVLAAHRVVDLAVLDRLGIDEDAATTALVEAQITLGRNEWLCDPWMPHEEHLFEPDVLRSWHPGV